MVAATVNAGSLVAGKSGDQGAALTIEAVRAFMHRSERVEVGAVLTLPRQLARELVGMGKAIIVEAAEPSAEPASPADSPDKPADKRRGRHARE